MAPISASTRATATNKVCRPGWRGEDGAGAAANLRPPVMDLPNKRFRLSLIGPAWFGRNVANSWPEGVTSPSWWLPDPSPGSGVMVKFREITGDDHGGAIDG